MGWLLYDLALICLTAILAPWMLYCLAAGRWGMDERLGLKLPAPAPGPGPSGRGGPRFWFHGASMGEVAGLKPLIDEVVRRWPDAAVAVSTTSLTGRARAAALLGERARVFLLPWELPWSLERVLRAVEPGLLVLSETELWPNLIRVAARRGALPVMVNARVTAAAFKRYRRFAFLFGPVLRRVVYCGCQTAEDLRRLRLLGIREPAAHLTGSTKADFRPAMAGAGALTREGLGIDGSDLIWVAGSTRPGEEEVVLDAFRRLRPDFPGLKLVLVPRHLDRLPEIEAIIGGLGLPYRLHGRAGGLDRAPIVLIDRMGMLLDLYRLADIALVGGGIGRFGGHNPLEPAGLGVPVIYGPHMGNQAEAVRALSAAGGGFTVENGAGLAETMRPLLRDKDYRRRAGHLARQAARSLAGTAARLVDDWRRLGLVTENTDGDGR